MEIGHTAAFSGRSSLPLTEGNIPMFFLKLLAPLPCRAFVTMHMF